MDVLKRRRRGADDHDLVAEEPGWEQVVVDAENGIDGIVPAGPEKSISLVSLENGCTVFPVARSAVADGEATSGPGADTASGG